MAVAASHRRRVGVGGGAQCGRWGPGGRDWVTGLVFVALGASWASRHRERSRGLRGWRGSSAPTDGPSSPSGLRPADEARSSVFASPTSVAGRLMKQASVRSQGAAPGMRPPPRPANVRQAWPLLERCRASVAGRRGASVAGHAQSRQSGARHLTPSGLSPGPRRRARGGHHPRSEPS